MSVCAPPLVETVSIKQAAIEVGVHENTIRHYFDRGVIAGYKLPSGHRKITRVELDRVKAELFAVPSEFPTSQVIPAPEQQSDPQYAESRLP